jgi:hypothetical protein
MHTYMGLVGVVYGAESCIPEAVRLVGVVYGAEPCIPEVVRLVGVVYGAESCIYGAGRSRLVAVVQVTE